MFNNDKAKEKWMKKYLEKIQFRAEHLKEVVPRVANLLKTSSVKLWDQPDPHITVDQHKLVSADLYNAQVIIGAPKLAYRFSRRRSMSSDKIDVDEKLS